MTGPPGLEKRPMHISTFTSLVRTRLIDHAFLLIGLAAIIIGFVVLGGLRLDIALAGYVLALVLAAILPLPADTGQSPPPFSPAIPVQRTGVDAISAFTEALGDPSLLLNVRGEVVYLNEAAARQYPKLQQGRVLTLALRNPELVAAIEGAVRTGQARSFELHETLPSETWDRVIVAPLPIPDGDWLASEDRQLLVTFQSLTELRRVDAMRSDFIANASHELRTPLASLVGFIDTLLGPAARDDEARARFLGIMQGQAERMSRLIDDLLSLSRIEMHQHVRPTGVVDLAGLLGEVREGLQIQAREAELDVILAVPETPVMVTGDRGQLYEVFENLLDNAIKYGAGGKSVEVNLSAIERPGTRFQVSVVDHGPGVEPEHVPRMTERFYRIDAEASRKKKGTGLGLAIVKHIVQRHRGQISIRSRSRPGEGLRVEILLP